jgi:hypothetical protein
VQVAVVVLVCGLFLSVAVASAAGGSNLYVTITDVEVSDTEPVTGDTVTVTPAIGYSDTRDGGFQISRITLVNDGQSVDVVRNVGMLAPGESMTVPLRATVERTDDHDSLTEEIKQLLGWDDDESDREIGREHVDRYEDDAIYLRGNS